MDDHKIHPKTIWDQVYDGWVEITLAVQVTRQVAALNCLIASECIVWLRGQPALSPISGTNTIVMVGIVTEMPFH